MHRDATVILHSADDGLEVSATVRRGDAVGIGRARSEGIAIPHVTVARRHARLRQDGYEVTIEDLGSAGGTFVNDGSARGPVALERGDRIRLGAVQLVVTSLRMSELMTPSEVRQAHDGGAREQTADSAPVDAARLSVRSMNFGQAWRTPGVEEVRWTAALPPSFVADLLGARLREHVKDSLAYPDPDDPLEAALALRNWPTAAEVLALGAAGLMPPELAELLLQKFAWDLAAEWFGTGPPEREPGFVINTVSAALGPGAQARLEGTARRSRIAVAFQDV